MIKNELLPFMAGGGSLTYKELVKLWKSDLYRYAGNTGWKSFVKQFLMSAGFKYSFYMRLSRFFLERNNRLLEYFFRFILQHYIYKYGISISHRTNIGAGLYIGHFGTIFISKDAIIGNNLNISQGVTIGQTNRGDRIGVPIIGDNVYLGPGCKVIGGIKIGNNVAVGANAVVTKDVPDNAVVVGIPAKVISLNGSGEYIHNNDYLT